MNPDRDPPSIPPALRRWDAASDADLEASARRLATGAILLAPTESTYCLAASPRHPDALAGVRRIKSRTEARDKALLLLCASVEQVRALAILDERAERLAAEWPAPLTLLLHPKDAALARALGSDSVAVRVPDHPVARRLAALAGPFTGTSANHAGEPGLVDPARAGQLAVSGLVEGIVDAGVLPGGPPSTLVDVRGGPMVIVRQGAFPAGRLAALA